MKRFDVPSLFVIQSSVMFEIPQRCISHVTDGGSGKLKKNELNLLEELS
jgi:hypothetical protein